MKSIDSKKKTNKQTEKVENLRREGRERSERRLRVEELKGGHKEDA